MSSSLSQTPLYDWHAAHGGRLVDFAGWAMPVQYGSIVAEHNATRTAAGLFDVSHMGRLRFTGAGAASFLDSLVTRRVADMPVGQIRYATVCNERGGILDDVLVYHLAHADGGSYHVMVVNASNREKIVAWIERHLASRGDATGDVKFADITLDTAMIAVQGPLALELLRPRTELNLAGMKYYHGAESLVAGRSAIVSRTGYTGEDGCELILPATAAREIWEGILADGHSRGAMAAGLGARDTLRLEAAMPLYGHELSEEINPLEAGIDFAVNLKDRKFIGSEALAAVKHAGPKRVRIGLQLHGKRVPREHYAIYAKDGASDGSAVGEVTSGTFSPTLNRPIAMGYVPPEHAKLGSILHIHLRGTREPAEVVPLPFYTRTKN